MYTRTSIFMSESSVVMIPDLPDGMLQQDILDFYDKLSGNLTDQATIHVHWWTHRQNPAVCWICDMVTLLSKILDISQEIKAKSLTDMMTDESSAIDSDSESEIESYNHNEEEPSTEPEYDIVEDEEQAV